MSINHQPQLLLAEVAAKLNLNVIRFEDGGGKSLRDYSKYDNGCLGYSNNKFSFIGSKRKMTFMTG